MIIPGAIAKILNNLHNHGFSAHLVGGCVRDYFLAREQNDYDIATSATPNQVMEIFLRTIPTGLKHGTVTVLEDGMACEVTTYRIDGVYDGRRPQSVEFTDQIELDLARRDFTMNAIAFDGHNYVDPFGGIHDLEKQIIRAVGNPEQRFNEDALRMLRAIRFSAQLGFNIDSETKLAISKNSVYITKISAERIRDELDKILISDEMLLGMTLLKEVHLLKHILPDINALSDEMYQSMLSILSKTKSNLTLRLCALLMYVPNDAENILNRLKYNKKRIMQVNTLLVKQLTPLNTLTVVEIKKLIGQIGYDLFLLLLDLQAAKISANTGLQTKKSEIEDILMLSRRVIESKAPIAIKDLAVSGSHLRKLGYDEGKRIGIILNDLLELVLENPIQNEEQKLIQYVKEKYSIESN